jgi:hypothetical protein
MEAYKTGILADYQRAYLDIAEDIFARLSGRVPWSQLKRHKGSFTIVAANSQETAAKIVIYDLEVGRDMGLPRLWDGVYILIRANDSPSVRIWNNVAYQMPQFFGRMDRAQPIAVAPKYDAKFTHFPVMAGSDLNEIVSLLVECSQA